MAEFNLDYYTQIDGYSDGDIEDTMLDMAKRGVSYESLEPGQVEFPLIYHFSKIRHNILNWYPFREGASVLEIGSGCGAITGLLCERCARVVAVELSKRRAEINYSRHKEFDNLCIMVGNLNDMEFQEKFDYIVLNGVLEYAASFTEGEKPYVAFLKKMARFLKPDGRLLIAIENRLGLKYFAGAPEDHTDLFFLGLNNYEGNNSVRTFSKSEMIHLLEDSDIPNMRFYYPYPDYKFPKEIFTDETLKTNGYGRPYDDLTGKRINLFNESKIAHDLTEEEIADKFANSFLVEASAEALIDTKLIKYVKINSERKPEFQIFTSIISEDNSIYVNKEAISRENDSFIQAMVKNSADSLEGKFSYLPAVQDGHALRYEYIQGQTLFELIKKYIKRRDRAKVMELLKDFYETYFSNRQDAGFIYTEEFKSVFGDASLDRGVECVSPANIDLICDNIFIGKDANYIIDYEWIFNFPVPVAFCMWRMINDLYTRLPELAQVVDRYDLHDLFGITVADSDVYLKWSIYFAYEYVGCDALSRYACQAQNIDLGAYAKQQQEKLQMYTRLYYDTGKGLNEEECLIKTLKIEHNRFTVEFDLTKIEDIRYLKWEVNKDTCWCIIDSIDSECQMGLLPSGNFIEKNNKTVFLEEHPSYIVDTFSPDQIGVLKITGRMGFLSKKLLAKEIAALTEMMSQKEKQLLAMAEKQKNIQQQLDTSVAVEAQEESVRQLLKKAVKKIVRKDVPETPVQEENIAYASAPTGSVDLFHYENDVLHAAGWAHDMSFSMENKRIAYYKGTECVGSHAFVVIYRSDVAAALSMEEAEASGFAMTARVVSPYDLKVVLEYDTPAGKGGMVLGEISANSEASPQDGYTIIPCMDENQIGDIRYFCEHYVTRELDIPPAIFGYKIDIIIPVYNGIDYFDALFDGLEKTNMQYRLLIVNDKSPDERVLPYLENYAKKHKDVMIINNEENLGFVGSVNHALQYVENHVVLLNTDVVVSYQWLERLMIPILCQEKVATTTPFTNSGTTCSFPNFCEDNEIFYGMRTWQVDEAFRMIKPQYPVMPTGIGFCMGMNLHAIHEVGVLDAETFGKGFGEENDWCQRAIEAGYKNVQVDNLFVYHKHCGSFLSEEKQRLLEVNSKALLKKHPNYNNDTAKFCQIDPMKSVRLFALTQLMNRILDVKTTVAFDHNLGGGATEYLDKKIKEILQKGEKFIIVRYDISENKYRVVYMFKNYRVEFFTEKLSYILPMLGRVDEIWINELVTYQNIFKVMDTIMSWREDQGAYLKMLLHDFFALCPAVNLMNQDLEYCDVPNVEVCASCIPANRSNACLDYESAQAWRAHWSEFLVSCDEVTVFSENSAELLARVYPDLNNVKLVPHVPHYLPTINKTHKTTKTLNIGLLGILSIKKGLRIVEQMAEYIEKENLNIRLCLIGATEDPFESPVFTQTGRYAREELPKLALQLDIDIFFIPAIWPETFSYTTSEIISMGYPIAVFRIGAPVERVSRYERGLVLERDASIEDVVLSIQKFANDDCGIQAMPVNEKKILFIAEEISFASRYRVEHFREQLSREGYASDYIQIAECEEVNIAEYMSVVIYRCSDLSQVSDVTAKAKKFEVPVYYDIDDFIFDYDKILYLDFLKEDEYKDFRQKTEDIHKCMELCDGYLTSTYTLRDQIQSEFTGKPVVIKRNVASLEMQILSMNAWMNTKKDDEKIWIGYFSGSATHNKDLALIEDVLDEIMQEYSNVYLKFGGVIQESKLKKYESRIDKFGFTEWQKLPELIAGVDINLMPLENTKFHCCKSENKWMEAALVHVPSVMSENAEMSQVVENGVTGFLCKDTTEWKAALVKLIESEELRGKVGDAANKRVLTAYTTEESAKDAVLLVTGNLK